MLVIGSAAAEVWAIAGKESTTLAHDDWWSRLVTIFDGYEDISPFCMRGGRGRFGVIPHMKRSGIRLEDGGSLDEQRPGPYRLAPSACW